jgi:diguanylate cyclase (GGDEF)-like protein
MGGSVPARASARAGRDGFAIVLWAVPPSHALFLLIAHDRLTATTVSVVTSATLTLLQVLSVALGARGAFDRRLSGAARRPWRWVFAGSLVLFTVTALFAASTFQPALGPLAAAVRLPYPALVVAAMFSFPAPRRSRAEQVALALDMMMVIGATCMAFWYFVIGPAFAQGVTAGNVLPTVAMPILDLMMIAGGYLALVRGVAPHVRRSLLLLLGFSGFLVVPDIVLALAYASGTQNAVGEGIPPVSGFFLVAGFSLLILAIHDGRRTPAPDAEHDDATDTPAVRLPYLPYLAVLVGFVLLLGIALTYGLYPWGGLVIATVVMTGGLVIRQLLPLLETRRLAGTDPLTGLANRRTFGAALQGALNVSRRSQQTVAVLLFDLNGFKQINDTLGHAVGDAALVAFADVLRRDVLGRETVARLGGDEFAIVLHEIDSPGQAVIVAERIIGDLAEPVRTTDPPLHLRTSIGIALATGAERGVQDLLTRADLALYDAKRTATRTVTSTWRVYTEDLARRGDAESEPAAVPARGSTDPFSAEPDAG